MKKLLKPRMFVFIAVLFLVVACNPIESGNKNRDNDSSGGGYTPPQRYWVTFNVGEGTGTPKKQLVTAGEKAKKPDTDPQSANVEKPFIHWAAEPNGIAPYDFDTPVRGPLELYAVYGIKVTVNYGNGTNNSIVPGQKLSELKNAKKKQALFKHWSTTESGSPYDITQPVTAPITLYAVYHDIQDNQTRVFDIQGTSHTSPKMGERVAALPGIVTAIRYSNGTPSGFYMQDQDGDNNNITSDGIYIFCGSANVPDGLKTGDAVTVNGMVTEYTLRTKKPTDPAGLTTTQIKVAAKANVTILSSRNELPAAVEITADKLERPVFTGNLNALDPEQEAIDYYESLEGMRVKISSPKVVAAPYKDTQYVASASAQGLTPRGGIMYNSYNSTGMVCIYPYACFAHKNEANVDSRVTIGDSYNGDIVGVIGYSLYNYQIEITEKLPPLTRGQISPEMSKIMFDPAQLNIVSYNLENFSKGTPNEHSSDKSPEERATEFADHFVNKLKAPDVICLIEIQDDSTRTNDGTVSAQQTLQLLIDKINAISTYMYQPVNIDPKNNEDGGAPGANIRCCYLYRTDRIEMVADSDSNFNNSNFTTQAAVITGGLKLQQNPARIGVGNPAFNNCRKSLVAHFKFKDGINSGKDFFVINNHLTSKRGDGPIWGAMQPVMRTSEANRLLQADAITNFIMSVKNERSDARIISVGDYNDFWFSETMSRIKRAGMKNAIEYLPENERYTYVYSGHSQTLDNILVTENIGINYADVLHLNAEFPRNTRLSDHDPVFVTLNLQ